MATGELERHLPQNVLMPVVVTGASGLIGVAAVTAFSRRSPEVRAYVRRPEATEEARASGADAEADRLRPRLSTQLLTIILPRADLRQAFRTTTKPF